MSVPGLAASAQPLRQTPDFEAVYAECFDFVWRSLRRLGVPERLVDDAAHDVFVVVHRRLGEFEGRSAIRTWLFGIALRVASGYRARERRDAPSDDLEPDPPASERHRPDREFARREEARLLERVLEELADDRRAVLVAVEIEQLSVPEVAEALGVPLNTAYSRLRLARRDFEQVLGRLEAQAGWRSRCKR